MEKKSSQKENRSGGKYRLHIFLFNVFYALSIDQSNHVYLLLFLEIGDPVQEPPQIGRSVQIADLVEKVKVTVTEMQIVKEV